MSKRGGRLQPALGERGPPAEPPCVTNAASRFHHADRDGHPAAATRRRTHMVLRGLPLVAAAKAGAGTLLLESDRVASRSPLRTMCVRRRRCQRDWRSRRVRRARSCIRAAKRSEQAVRLAHGQGRSSLVSSGKSLRRSGRHESPDRARRLRAPCQLTELASSGPRASSQRGPATGAGTCRSTQVGTVWPL